MQNESYKNVAKFFVVFAFFFVFVPKIVLADVTQNVVTASRTIGTTYQNTTGFPLFVAASVRDNWGLGGTVQLNMEIGVLTAPTTTVATCSGEGDGPQPCEAFGVVPNGWFYRVRMPSSNSPTITSWTEWAMASTTSGGGSSSIATSTVIAMVLSAGFSTSSNMIAEISDPNRDLAYGIFFFLLTFSIIIFYFRAKQ